MSLLKTNSIQIGQSSTATQNFTLAVPAAPDGTIKLARGNSGATTSDILNIANDGRVSFGKSPIGSVLQVVKSSTNSIITCSTTIPWDDTIPQNTEGTEVLTASITPISATSTLFIKFLATGAPNSAGSNSIASALFVDSTANALAVIGYPNVGNNWQTALSLSHYLSSSNTTARTYKIRVGRDVGTFYINADTGGTRKYGGAAYATLEIWEIEG